MIAVRRGGVGQPRWRLGVGITILALGWGRCRATPLEAGPQTLAGTYTYTATFGDGAPLATGRLTLLDGEDGAVVGTIRLTGACRRPDETPIDCVVAVRGQQGDGQVVTWADAAGWTHAGVRTGRGQIGGTWQYVAPAASGGGVFRGRFTARLEANP